jgi:hypothetical protein
MPLNWRGMRILSALMFLKPLTLPFSLNTLPAIPTRKPFSIVMNPFFISVS